MIDKTYEKQVLLLSVGFLLLFAAFNPAQNFQTSEHPHQAGTILGALYICFTFTNLISSPIINKLGSKKSLVIGSVTYILFVASNIEGIYTPTLSVICSSLCGIGASILWTAQGSHVTKCSQIHEYKNGLKKCSTLGKFNGIFWSVFQMSQFGGNLLVALLLTINYFKTRKWIVFSLMSVMGSVGVFILSLLKNIDGKNILQEEERILDGERAGIVNTNNVVVDVDNDDVNKTISNDDVDNSTVKQEVEEVGEVEEEVPAKLSETLLLCLDSKLYLMIPIILYSGLSQTFIFGDFPGEIQPNNLKFYVLAWFGALDAISSYIIGKQSDKFGRRIMLIIGTVCHLILYLYQLYWGVKGAAYTYFIQVSFFAIGDGAFNTQIYAVVGLLFPEKRTIAFANLKLYQAFATSMSFFWHKWFTYNTKLQINIAAALVGIACFLICRSKFEQIFLKSLKKDGVQRKGSSYDTFEDEN